MQHPGSAMGALQAVALGTVATVIALLIAQFVPSIIPARASAVQL
jgi:hypothetical protein